MYTESDLKLITDQYLPDYVGKYVELKHTDKYISGICPFHDEKTPSFFVRKNNYKCFGCGKSGNIINFVMEYHNYSFKDAVEYLAEYYNINLEKDDIECDSKSFYRLYEKFTNICHDKLLSNSLYIALLKRIPKEIVDYYRIGYVNGNIYSELSKYFSSSILYKAGLFNKNQQCLFDERLLIPITSFNKIIGFAGRSIYQNTRIKYKNSPETKFFKKSSVLFNFDKAIRTKSSEVFIVEGYFDVFALIESGVPSVVACMGTTISSFNLKRLSAYFDDIIFVFDGDSAGRSALMSNLDNVISSKTYPKVILLPANRDPENIVKLGKNINSYPRLDYFTHIFDQLSLDHIKPILSKLHNSVNKQKYIQAIASKYNLSLDLLYLELLDDPTTFYSKYFISINHEKEILSALYNNKIDRNLINIKQFNDIHRNILDNPNENKQYINFLKSREFNLDETLRIAYLYGYLIVDNSEINNFLKTV